ncbi:hypothetical protein [Streptomyces sp. NPDC004546]|uniref:hypothetical protein n=1 Tax=Streptomyces sp. NPDC004546 TaxID=3154282 RepID=UPI0033AAE1CC
MDKPSRSEVGGVPRGVCVPEPRIKVIRQTGWRDSLRRTADKVKSAAEWRPSAHEERFGSGGSSPCSTASAKKFTQECGAAGKATGEDAWFALTQISGQDGFATLRSVAEKIQKAAARYQEVGCATNPTEAATRQACLTPATVLAQGFPDLRDGANLGLAAASSRGCAVPGRCVRRRSGCSRPAPGGVVVGCGRTLRGVLGLVVGL